MLGCVYECVCVWERVGVCVRACVCLRACAYVDVGGYLWVGCVCLNLYPSSVRYCFFVELGLGNHAKRPTDKREEGAILKD